MTWRPAGGSGSPPANRTGSPYHFPRDGQPQNGPAPDENAGWSIFSYLIAGMVAYGLIGWLAAWLTHIQVLLPLGALVGLVFAIVGVVWKYGRHR